MQDAVDALANDIRAIDGNHDMGAGVLAEALVKLGWVKTRKLEHPPLSAYRVGQGVMVLNSSMDWVEGTITDRTAGLLMVAFDGGQTTIGSPFRITPFRAGDDG